MAQAEDLSPLAGAVRDFDPNRFQTALFAPAEQRENLMALYAFNVEIARIAETVSEALIGEMRLQWWHDLCEGAFSGAVIARGHPVGEAMERLIAGGRLDRPTLRAAIAARRLDLAAEPFATPADLRGYAEDTAGGLSRLAAALLGADPPTIAAAGHVGTAWGLLGVVRTLCPMAAQGRLYLPSQVAAERGVTREDLSAPPVAEAAKALCLDLVGEVEELLAEARALRRCIDRRHLSPFLLAPLARPYLALLRQSGGDPADPGLWTIVRRPFSLFWTGIRGRI
ncbi:phytoene synthase [Rhodospirillum rubrum]|uniref:phytoene/squalene synthase family protein n=1 Tax=Rhodospirillum rubrum TaxID=1085 RepID=UPI0019047D32|nr:phytoene/squalene synthase family protein [Rhodospirillum rubrum]MBK1663559.1 phytoene synthase [Rhodospirillum rubrum]MBK1675640.1 phytoene synthase [Rhodospirillum rubrum]